jgi:ribose transport system permease protein
MHSINKTQLLKYSKENFFILSRILSILILIIFLSIVSPQFLGWNNIVNIFRQASIQFLISAGLTLVIITAGIDLAVGAILGLSACLSASLIVSGHLGLGIVAGLISGLFAGALNGLLVAFGRITPFIATYGVLWIAGGIGYVFMKGEVLHSFPPGFRFIGTGILFGIPVTILIAGIILVILHLLLHKTVFGRYIYAIGGNPIAARLSGISVKSKLFYVYTLSGLLSSFAALVIMARVNSVDSSIGEELLLPAIAAVCLGGASLFGGVGGIAGTAIGALILALVINGMNLLGVPSFWQSGVMGAIILGSVLADQYGSGRSLIKS